VECKAKKAEPSRMISHFASNKREAFVNQATSRKIMPFLLKTLIVVVVGVVV